MELDFAQQTTAFLWSIIPGIALGLIYGIIKFLRALFKIGKAGTFVLDIIFMIVFFLSVFIFSLAYIYGYIRAYVIAGFAIGFSAYRLTIGMLLSKIYYPVI